MAATVLTSFIGVVVLAMWASHRWAGHPLVTGVTVTLALWGVFQFAAAGHVMTANLRLWGQELNTLVKRTRKYRALSESPVPFFNRMSAYVGLLVLCLSFVFEIRWVGLAVALLGTCAFQAARFIQPPFVLLLGASGPASRQVAKLATAASYPHLATNLLAVVKNENMTDAVTKAGTWRVQPETLAWKDAVHDLAQLAKVVILDVRQVSEAVHEEFRILSTVDVWFKTAVVVETVPVNGLSALFGDEEGPRIRTQAATIQEDEVAPMLSFLKKAPDALPSQATPMATVPWKADL